MKILCKISLWIFSSCKACYPLHENTSQHNRDGYCLNTVLLHRKQRITVLAGFPLTAGPHTVINRQRKKITDLLNLLTQSSELIAWGRSRNTRVWAGPVTRMLSLKSNRADIQLIPSRNLSTILLVCSWLHFRKGLAEAWQKNTGLWLKPITTKAQIVHWAALLLWLALFYLSPGKPTLDDGLGQDLRPLNCSVLLAS